MRRALMRLGMLALACFISASPASVHATRTTYLGCLECDPSLDGTSEYCSSVGNEETGFVQCDETNHGTGAYVWYECNAHGSPCFNVTVTGGGGGGWGGGGGGGAGGGGTCYTRPGAFCPASCTHCEPMLY